MNQVISGLLIHIWIQKRIGEEVTFNDDIEKEILILIFFYNPYITGNVKKFNDLKRDNPQLKTIAAVGGWNEGSRKFSNVAKDPAKRQRFISTSLKFILSHNFDGLDLDWEYPAQRDGDPDVDKENHAIFVRELKEEYVFSHI